MKKTLIISIFTSLAIMLMVTGVAGNGDLDHERGRPRGLVGTWNATVTLLNCADGTPLPIPPIQALNTFLENGSMLETGNRSGNRSPGHGTWASLGRNRYEIRFMFFLFNADGTPNGRQEVHGEIQLSGRDQFTAISTFQVFNANGGLVAEGCATQSSTRFD